MDVFTAIKGRRSCRKFRPDMVSDGDIEKILEAASWAPSPANNQPWEFIVVTDTNIKLRIHAEAVRCKNFLFEKSGWKWLGRYEQDFIRDAPVIIAIIGDPQKTGADMFLEGGGLGYQEGCAAAIQNMLLAAHALGLGALWYTMFHKTAVQDILSIEPAKNLIALIIIGRPAGDLLNTQRIHFKNKTRYL
jgi:5,6-dimethylbenzimidazole synthase